MHIVLPYRCDTMLGREKVDRVHYGAAYAVLDVDLIGHAARIAATISDWLAPVSCSISAAEYPSR